MDPDNIQDQLSEIDAALHSKLAGDGDTPPRENDAEAIAEEEAGRKGWVPKEKYRGDPAKWKPASQFLEDGKRYNKTLETRLERLERENEELKRSGKAFAEYHEQQMQSKQQEIDNAIKQLRVEKSRATADGEHTLAVEIEDRIELLKEEKKGLKPETDASKRGAGSNDEAVNSLVVREWVEDGNDWFDNSPELRQYAFDYANTLVNQTQVRGRKFLDMVAEHMREEFPRQFAKLEGKQTPPARRNDQVEGGAVGSNDRTGGKYTIHDLPAEDLALMRDFVAKGWTTQEKFLRNYFSDEKKVHRTPQK